MRLKREYLKKSQLYLISNENLKAARKSLEAGSNIVQLRIKDKSDHFFLAKAKALRKITRKLNKILIINDRPDIALLAEADGVHLGRSDLPVKEARKLLGRNKIIGRSTHSLSEALKVAESEVDYLGIGPAFPTKTKDCYKCLSAETIKKIIDKIKIPYFVIGGINARNISILLSYQIKKVAVFSSIIKSKDPSGQTKKILKKLES
jgi:thiamine-phosphate pyrophosphorylase